MIKHKVKKNPVNPIGHIGTFRTLEHTIMGNKELNAREWAKRKGVSYKQTLRWLADPEVRKSKLPGAYQMQRRGTWFIPVNGRDKEVTEPLTAEDIVIEDERRRAVLAHFEDLRATATHWKSELWLPPPWRWDVAHLEFVFYMDTKKVARGVGVTGYKLPVDLVDSEESKAESKGHFRHFMEGCVHYAVQEDGAIIVKLPVEDEVSFGHLKVHTEESPAWGLFAKWKEEGGIYIQLCSSLLARIEQDAKAAIGAKSELSWWAIYHDAFCTKDTLLRCGTCGTENPSAFVCPSCDGKFSQAKVLELHIRDNHLGVDPKAWPLPHCQNCHLPLGWLRSILRQYESTTEGLQSTPIHIHGWGNIEESVEIGRFEGMKRGHRDLKVKYQGHDLVETILQREKEVKEIRAELNQAVESLSQQRVFAGSCEACPL